MMVRVEDLQIAGGRKPAKGDRYEEGSVRGIIDHPCAKNSTGPGAKRRILHGDWRQRRDDVLHMELERYDWL
jgi:hypothetical protein